MPYFLQFTSRIPLVLIALSVSLDVISAEDHHHHHSLEAHTHGIATLSISIEGEEVWLNLQSPAANIVGFEYRAQTEDELHFIDDAKATAAKPAELFKFKGGNCSLDSSDLDFSAVMPKAHAHNHSHHDHDHENHAEISLTYNYRCKQSNRLSGMHIEVQNAFPSIKYLEVQWINDNGSNAAMLDHHNHEISFE